MLTSTGQSTPSGLLPIVDLTKYSTDAKCFPFSNFTYYWTLFSKFFSSFPHGTCLLSVSWRYLALDGVYHQLWAAISNNPTLKHCSVPLIIMPRTLDGTITLSGTPFQRTLIQAISENMPSNYNSPKRLQIWADPCSFAITKGILVSFFSSAY